MQIPGNHNTSRATVMPVEDALDAMVHPGKANARIPDASGGMPHPMVFAGNVAARGHGNVRKAAAPSIPDSNNGVKGMLA